MSLPLASTPLLLFGLSLAAPSRAAQDGPPAPAQEPGEVVLALPEMSLTVEEAIGLALRSNPGLEQAKVAAEIAEFDSIGSWGDFEWVFDSSVRYTDSTTESRSQFGGGIGQAFTSTTYAGSVGFTRPLTTGGQFRADFRPNYSEGDNAVFATSSWDDSLTFSFKQPLLRGAWSESATSAQREFELVRDNQLEALRSRRQTLITDVENRYWDLVAAIELRQVGVSSLELGERQRSREQTKLDAGVGTEVEVIQAEAEVARRKEVLLQRETAVRQAMDDLKVLLYGPNQLQEATLWDTVLTPITELPAIELDSLPTWSEAIDVAHTMRSDLRQQRAEIEIAKVRHERALSTERMLLDLDLSAGAAGFDPTSTGRVLDETARFDFPTYTAALTFSTPIGNARASYAEKSARARIRQAGLAYDELETSIAAGVRRALRDVQYRALAVDAAKTSLYFATRQLEAEEAKYEEGLSTLFQVFEFQQVKIEGESSLQTAKVEYAKARVALRSGQGVTGEDASASGGR